MGSCQAPSDIVVPSNFEGIIIKSYSWKKTYSNLFDFGAEKNQIVQQVLTLNAGVGDIYTLMKDGERFKIEKQVLERSIADVGMMQYLKIMNKAPNYIIQPNENSKRLSGHQVWLVVKSTPSHKYKVKEGDILRIGNQKVKVKQIILQDNLTESNMQIQAKYKVYQNLIKQNSQGYNPKQNQQQPMCRVCLEQADFGNPLLAPCKCSGSAKFIHIKCIQQWFNKIIDPKKINSSIVIKWKPLVCQLCNTSLPFKIYLDEVKNFIVNIPRPQKPYIVLNPITKQKTSTKIYHLVSFNQKKSLTIGRKKDADIILDQDSSISRHHSLLQFQMKTEQKKGRVLISDKDSKFGTLVLLKKPINLNSNLSGVTLQFGGNIATFIYKQNCGQAGEDQINQSDESTSTQSMNDEHHQHKQQQVKRQQQQNRQ